MTQLAQNKDEVYVKLGGIVQDLPPEEAGNAWSNGQNVFFWDQATRRIAGWLEQFVLPAGEAPVFLLPVETTTSAYWIVVVEAATPKVYAWDGSASLFDITPTDFALTSVKPGVYTGDRLNGVPVLNNGADVPFTWNGNTGTRCQKIPGWDDNWRCKAMRAYKYHLFALGMTESGSVLPDFYRWSAAAAPGALPQAWVAAAGNQAGSNTFAEGQGILVDAVVLRDSLVIFKNFNCQIATYTGGNQVFNIRNLFSRLGMYGIGCGVEVQGGRLVVMSNDDIVVTDGQNLSSIATEKVRTAIFASIDPDKANWCQVVNRHVSDEIWVTVPEIEKVGIELAWVYNPLTGEWGKRKLPNVSHIARGILPPSDVKSAWDDDPEPWDSDITYWDQPTFNANIDELLMADYVTPAGRAADLAPTEDGQPVTAFIERTSMPIDDMPMLKYVEEFIPDIRGSDGDVVQISLGFQNRYDEPVRWQPARAFTIGRQRQIYLHGIGRYISVRVQSTGGFPWQLYGFRLKKNNQGRY